MTGKGDTRLADNRSLRIDTATGKVWRYLGIPNQGKRMELQLDCRSAPVQSPHVHRCPAESSMLSDPSMYARTLRRPLAFHENWSTINS